MPPAAQNLIAIGDVVQIAPILDHTSTGFGGCFLVVTEVKSWGVYGYVPVPERKGAGLAFYRVSYADIIPVGRAEWMRN